MKVRWLLLVFFWCAQASGVAASQAGSMSAPPVCPAPSRTQPEYPADAVRLQQGGTVLLDVRIDACGRVLGADVKSGSGLASLDQSALAAVSTWVLDPRGIAGPGGGRVQVPVGFDIAARKPLPFSQPDWPASHRRPSYVMELLDGYATPGDVLDRYPLSIGKKYSPPYPTIRNLFFRQGGEGSNEYWLFLYVAAEPGVAARYRLVTENGQPVVRMAFLCGGTQKRCARDRKFLMKGLPFARAK